MKTTPEPPFALPTTADKMQIVKSSSYLWDSSKRGKKRYVILQQTIRGSGRFRFQGQESRLPEGSVMISLVPEASAYFFEPADAPEWVFRWINFEGESALDLWGGLRKRFGPVLALGSDSGAGRAIERLIDDVADGRLGSLQVQAEAVHSAFLRCWFQLESAEAGQANPATQLRELIRENFQAMVNIKQLCADVGQSREHLTRLFKKTFGTEPSAYLRDLRIGAAERFLLRSNLSIRDIAHRTGHAGAGQFTRAFLAATGKTPKEFRGR